ncbi:SMC-Scp complex subunit ScpB [Bifidobacterium sp. LC6]|uniref:SMC-Scp complex subunit ScpB n=2 Tax=Bifidobacterium colobi TaxID=2809026 RepID=A0ABS5UWM0_9BIFI|nr:SMC-Scp complex subunit ScpB [Bifidobacterium colobi]
MGFRRGRCHERCGHIRRRFCLMSDEQATTADFAVDDFPGGLPAAIEAILMVADQPQNSKDIARVLGVEDALVERTLLQLQAEYAGEGATRPRGFELRCTARGWQFANRAVFEPVVSAFVTDGQTARLSQAALEALAIVAYRQPVTRAQVAAIRGVNSDGVIRSLSIHGLIKEQGVDPESRAALLVTSTLFLERMGLDSLDQLPSLAPFLPPEAEMTRLANAREDMETLESPVVPETAMVPEASAASEA